MLTPKATNRPSPSSSTVAKQEEVNRGSLTKPSQSQSILVIRKKLISNPAFQTNTSDSLTPTRRSHDMDGSINNNERKKEPTVAPAQGSRACTSVYHRPYGRRRET